MHKHKRVLLVEDDAATRLMLQAMIEKLDHDSHVICVDNAEEALVKIEESYTEGYSFSLVLADIGLPRSNGLDLWRVCMRKYKGPHFAFVTGRDVHEVISQLQSHQGAVLQMPDLIEKPVSLDSLVKLWGTL